MGQRIAVCGLVLSHSALLLCVPQWLVWDGPDDYPFWLYVVISMLAHVQGCLLAVWVALRGRGTAGRACLVVFTITAGAWLLPRLMLQPTAGLMRAWLAAQLLQVLILLPPLLCVRLFGFSLVQSSDEQRNCIAHRPWYKTLQLILCTTTGLALIAFPYQLPWRIISARHSEWGLLGQGSVAGLSLLLVWLVLGPGRLVFRCLLCTILLALLIVVQPLPLHFLVAHGTCLITSLVVVRLGGNRLFWTTPVSSVMGSWGSTLDT